MVAAVQHVLQVALDGGEDPAEQRRATAAPPPLAAAAASSCSEAYAYVAGEMIQLHGGIGITWEHEAHQFFKRAHGSAQLSGPSAAHRQRLASHLGFLVPSGA